MKKTLFFLLISAAVLCGSICFAVQANCRANETVSAITKSPAPTAKYSSENPAIDSGSSSSENSAIESGSSSSENPAIESGPSSFENSAIDSDSSSFENSAIESGSSSSENPAIESGSSSSENPAIDSDSSSFENSAIDSGPSSFENSAIDSGSSSSENSAIDSGPSSFENPAIDSGSSSSENPAIDSDQVFFGKQDYSHFTETEFLVRGNRIDRTGLTLEPYQRRVTGGMFGEWSSLNKKFLINTGDRLNRGFKTSVFGGSLGWERLLGKSVLWGFTFYGASIDINPQDAKYSGSVSSFAGDLHLTLFGSQWYIDLLAGIGSNWNKNEIVNSTLWEFRTHQWNYNIDGGLRIREGFTKISPFLGVHATIFSEPGNSGFSSQNSLIASDETYTSCRLLLGSKFHWDYTNNLGTLMPHLYGFWTHEFCEKSIFLTNELNGFAFAYRFGEHTLPADRLNIGIGITYALRDSFDLHFNYNNTFTGNYSDSSVFGGFNKKY